MLRKKVLIVDDDPNLIRSLEFVFKQEGYEFDTATNGEEAIQKVREGKPSVLLLDIMMPKKNGFDVCQEVKSAPDLRDTHVVILSAKSQVMDKEKGYSAGADEYITKPFSPKSIVSRVKELLGDSDQASIPSQ
ncbi:MAG: response regulator [Dehalococcoidia bacterium]